MDGFLIILIIWSVCTLLGVFFRAKLPVPRVAVNEGDRVALIVPAKGRSDDTSLFIRALEDQTYRNFRLIWCIEAGDAEAKAAFETSGLAAYGIVAEAEGATRCCQKNQNLIAGMEKLEPNDRFVVMADCDTSPHRTWLGEIIAILAKDTADVVSAYRLQIPRTPSVSNLFISACETAVATAPRRVRIGPMHVCGGTIALRRESFDQVEYAAHIEATYNDDLVATYLFARHGFRVVVPRSMLLPGFVDGTWSSMLNFARRQYFATRIYSPLLYSLAVFILSMNVVLWLVAIGLAVMGNSDGFLALSILFGTDMLKTFLRRRYFNEILAGRWMRHMQPAFLITAFLGPVLNLCHLAVALSIVFGNGIRWSDRYYEVRGRRDIKVIPVED